MSVLYINRIYSKIIDIHYTSNIELIIYEISFKFCIPPDLNAKFTNLQFLDRFICNMWILRASEEESIANAPKILLFIFIA